MFNLPIFAILRQYTRACAGLRVYFEVVLAHPLLQSTIRFSLVSTDDAMDPLSVTVATASLTISVAKISQFLAKVKGSYDQAPMTVAAMMAECKTISTALTHLQTLTLEKPVALSSNLASPGTLMTSFDNALIGCMEVLSVIECELNKLVEDSGTMGFGARVRVLWNEETMSRLLQHLRGQHTAIGTLVSLLQV